MTNKNKSKAATGKVPTGVPDGIVWVEALSPFPYRGIHGTNEISVRIQPGEKVQLPVKVAQQYEKPPFSLAKILPADEWPDKYID